ncbi:hypothetical protein JCM11641_000522 [Rhodosporidiobolus odoratus]
MPWRDTRAAALPPGTSRFKAPPDPILLARLSDAHCHPSDDSHLNVDLLEGLKTGTLSAMSSALRNQDITKQVYSASPETVIPFFGLHPWYCHPLSFAPPDALPSKEEHYASLFPDPTDPSRAHPQLATALSAFPEPVPISIFIASLEENLLAHPTSHVGEIGLDRAFRIPNPPHISADKSNPKHTDLATPFEHQVKVVEAQVDLAIKLGRNISFHSVRAPQETVDVLRRFKEEKREGWSSIHICLHSFGGRAETAKQIQKMHHNIFFSFATIISGRSPHFHKLLQAIEPDRLLIESDFSDTAEIDNQMWECLEEIQEARGWAAEEAVAQLQRNWNRYMAPASERPVAPISNRQRRAERRRVDLYVSDEEEDAQEKVAALQPVDGEVDGAT